MPRRRRGAGSAAALAAFLALVPPAAPEERWVLVASPNFTLVTNSSASRGKEVARQFEAIRFALVSALPR